MPKPIYGRLLAACLVVCGLPAMAGAQSLDKLRYDAALATARDYAADQTLINYCLRGLGANGPYLYIWAHDNLERAIQSLKSAGGDPAQVEGLAKLVMTNVRFFAPDVKDAALEPQCTAREVEKNVAMLMGLSMPLHLRPPFKNFPR
jgi:hypothetical protein